MKLLAIAVKDIVRRKGKSLYVLTAVVIPVAILITIILTLDNADSSLSNLASKFGFTMTVQPKNIQPDSFDQIGVILDEYMPESVASSIEGIIKDLTQNKKDTLIITPRLYQRKDVFSMGYKINSVVAGINFKVELDARSTWSLDSGRWPSLVGETVIGGTYAKANGFQIGDSLDINDENFEIVGTLRLTNSSDDYMVFIPFGVAQELFESEGLASVINVQSVLLDKDKNLLNAAVEELNVRIPNVRALSPQQFSTMKYALLRKTFKFLLSIAAATVLVSIFSIFNIVTNALYSKVKEIGLLKTVGASRAQLFLMFLYEYSIIGVVGGMFGYVVGFIASYLLDSLFLEIGAAATIKPHFLLAALLVGVLCSLTASLYPTYKMSHIKITETFRTQWEV